MIEKIGNDVNELKKSQADGQAKLEKSQAEIADSFDRNLKQVRKSIDRIEKHFPSLTASMQQEVRYTISLFQFLWSYW